MMTNPSFGDISLGSPFNGGTKVLFLASRLIDTSDRWLGLINNENTCLPVQRYVGLKMAGGGMSKCVFPSDMAANICDNCAASKKVSLCEIKYDPVMKSCVAAMIGSPDFGVNKLFFTPIKFISSALASSVCGTCKFISSPSKSAFLLYAVTLSGYVNTFSTASGTATSSMDKFGSGEMTVAPEKSTRLPDKLPAKRPCLPFNLWHKPAMGFSCFPPPGTIDGTDTSEFIYMATESSRIKLDVHTISVNFTVKSSSFDDGESCINTEGLMHTGGAGKYLQMYISGLPPAEASIPKSSQSEGMICLNKFNTLKGFKSSHRLLADPSESVVDDFQCRSTGSTCGSLDNTVQRTTVKTSSAFPAALDDFLQDLHPSQVVDVRSSQIVQELSLGSLVQQDTGAVLTDTAQHADDGFEITNVEDR